MVKGILTNLLIPDSIIYGESYRGNFYGKAEAKTGEFSRLFGSRTFTGYTGKSLTKKEIFSQLRKGKIIQKNFLGTLKGEIILNFLRLSNGLEYYLFRKYKEIGQSKYRLEREFDLSTVM